MKKFDIFIILIDVILVLLFYYFALPPINLSSPEFWTYAFMICIIVFVSIVLRNNAKLLIDKHLNIKLFSVYKWFFIVVASIILVIGAINLFSTPLFNAKEYSERIKVDDTHEFTSDVKEVDFTKIPLIDRASSQKLGDRKMGEFTSWVSQFYVSDLYTQINYNNEIVRVTPIEYDGIIKYFTNRDEGVKGYIKVDSVTGSASLVDLSDGMRYLPSAYFFENLYRKLRIDYPTTIFDEASFEVDNDGNPYWVVPTIKYKGIGMKKEINGVVVLNAINGESKKYNINEVPTWIDHVYSADLIIEQIDNWGEYRNGFFNSIFGQKDVINTTEGYNYLVMDDDVYLYTGITSVSSDESNLGFVLVNMRTKETNYYLVPGAEEYSAMASAEGLVQEKKYVASFPLLINLNNKPTYLLSLKDNAGLVKMYAFIDVADYQKVVVSDASLGIEVAAEKYLGEEINTNNGEILTKTIEIKNISNAVIDGNTYYYIVSKDNELFSASIKVNKNILPFLKSGDIIDISYNESVISNIITLEKGKNNE